MSHLSTSHVTFIYESCHAQGSTPRSGAGGMISKWRCLVCVTFIYESCRIHTCINESCHVHQFDVTHRSMWLMHKHSVHDTHVIFLCVTLYRNMTWLWDLWVVMSRSSTWHDLLIHAQTWNDMTHGSSATLYPWVMSYLFIFIHIYSSVTTHV